MFITCNTHVNILYYLTFSYCFKLIFRHLTDHFFHDFDDFTFMLDIKICTA